MKGVTIKVLGFHHNSVDIQLTDYWNDNGSSLPDAFCTISMEEYKKNCLEHGIDPIIGIEYPVTEQ